MEKKDVIRYLRITEDVEARLEIQARARGISIVELLRVIIGESLVGMEKQTEPIGGKV